MSKYFLILQTVHETVHDLEYNIVKKSMIKSKFSSPKAILSPLLHTVFPIQRPKIAFVILLYYNLLFFYCWCAIATLLLVVFHVIYV